MSHTTHDHTRRRTRARLQLLLAGLAIAAAAVTLAACGGSSSSSASTSAANSASTTTDPSARASRFASLRACLQKEGIKLPSAPTGGQRPGGPPGAGGGFKLPEGVSQEKFREALRKCGGGFPGRRNLNSAADREGLTQFAQCMREDGVNLPAPNTSGKGPVFNTSGINTSSATFKNAQKRCQSDLRGAFGAGRPPAGGEGGPPPGGEGAPPAGGEAPESPGAG
jgi:hypothetical protein